MILLPFAGPCCTSNSVNRMTELLVKHGPAKGNKINDILNNPELALETGKKASEFIRSHASVGVSAQGFVKAIDN